MILTSHLVVGAVIATKVKSLPLAILLAFLSHYLLDSPPHIKYLIDNIKKKQWSKSGFDFLKLASDLLGGLSLVLVICYLTKVNCLILFTVAFFAILPDILLGLKWMFPGNELLRKHFEFHYKIHFPENKKIPALGRIAVEFLVVLAAFLLLLA